MTSNDAPKRAIQFAECFFITRGFAYATGNAIGKMEAIKILLFVNDALVKLKTRLDPGQIASLGRGLGEAIQKVICFENRALPISRALLESGCDLHIVSSILNVEPDRILKEVQKHKEAGFTLDGLGVMKFIYCEDFYYDKMHEFLEQANPPKKIISKFETLYPEKGLIMAHDYFIGLQRDGRAEESPTFIKENAPLFGRHLAKALHCFVHEGNAVIDQDIAAILGQLCSITSTCEYLEEFGRKLGQLLRDVIGIEKQAFRAACALIDAGCDIRVIPGITKVYSKSILDEFRKRGQLEERARISSKMKRLGYDADSVYRITGIKSAYIRKKAQKRRTRQPQ